MKRQVDPQQIQERAYQLYLARGETSGQELDDWLAAEKQLLGQTDGDDVSEEAYDPWNVPKLYMGEAPEDVSMQGQEDRQEQQLRAEPPATEQPKNGRSRHKDSGSNRAHRS